MGKLEKDPVIHHFSHPHPLELTNHKQQTHDTQPALHVTQVSLDGSTGASVAGTTSTSTAQNCLAKSSTHAILNRSMPSPSLPLHSTLSDPLNATLVERRGKASATTARSAR
ncbi:hypothetical protein QJS10_CPA03g02480 [Acorus calamus]|uniref:Uncharacterized protein n=1 Tax=Acorus calamus TaxID=4465 RepID=A0AAV9F9C1_ACOCL|nr:hypothetical protein QJS10_CPA03g02480 [Acorus calamus]